MKGKNDFGKILKWLPVAIAGLVAVIQAIGDQKESERVDEMEERIAALESKEGEEEE